MAAGSTIAMFDSGFGGLTVARAVLDLVPSAALVYLGDTARYPYGPRPTAEVRRFATQIGRYLVEHHDPVLLVVACNTATAAALDDVRQALPVPVIGVIDAGVCAAVKATVTGRIGVIGTVGTIDSGAYQRAFAAVDHDAEVCALSCPGLVEFVERGETQSPQLSVLVERLLAPMVGADVDTLLLGCTHYPFLARTIADVMGCEVVLVSSADETAFAVRAALGGGLLPNAAPEPLFLTTGDVAWFAEQGGRLLGPELAHAHLVELPPL